MRPLDAIVPTLLLATSLANAAWAQDSMPEDSHISFAEQLRLAPEGSVVLLNTFAVPTEQAEAFRQGWAKVAEILRRQPGFVSTMLHKPIGGSRLWVNQAVWESAASLAAALATAEFKSVAAQMSHVGFRRIYQIDTKLDPVR
ncbi:antibiotic biosynthesis monooxygenase family protein [Microvirga rosea]|uniref:antibiotic biosynthesis monooxygenase family protein n=1 Tax=Microvirga rosea TaxID=2715425 RepID=UPI001D0B05DB|nr:antibiotic biosynthesis monooxygenase family protein [Microvirga rosea]MCB8819504.1 antibiotic biosynthesis monooxygenase [Microvirga rosea]